MVNNQLRLCDLLVTIPTWEGYPILNLSHAVTVLCYTWFTSISVDVVPGTDGRILDPELRRILREEATRLVQLIPTKDHKRQGMDETLVRVIMRGLPKDVMKFIESWVFLVPLQIPSKNPNYNVIFFSHFALFAPCSLTVTLSTQHLSPYFS